MLVIDEIVVDFTFKTSCLKLVFAIFSILELNSVHVDFVDFDGILAPLTSQMLLVLSEKAAILGNFHLDFGIFITMSMQQVESRV